MSHMKVGGKGREGCRRCIGRVTRESVDGNDTGSALDLEVKGCVSLA